MLNLLVLIRKTISEDPIRASLRMMFDPKQARIPNGGASRNTEEPSGVRHQAIATRGQA